MFNKTVDKAVGTGARAKLAKAAADNAIWMPVTTCLLFAALKLAQGQPEEIASGLQVSLLPFPCRFAASMWITQHSFLLPSLLPKVLCHIQLDLWPSTWADMPQGLTAPCAKLYLSCTS